MAAFVETVAAISLIWVLFVIFVQAVGISAIYRYFSRVPQASVSAKLASDAPGVTIIRPVKGLEPNLYDCIASTFRQDYPADRCSIRLCVEDISDPAYPILEQLVDDFPQFDVRILVEAQDPVLHGPDGHIENLGPNPKIRNISRAYREAKNDIIWIIDCNVWVSTGVLGRMVDRLSGFAPQGKVVQPYKFVHHMPLVIDTEDYGRDTATKESLSTSTDPANDIGTMENLGTKAWNQGGGRLDEMFMATTHVKFYGAINSVGVAPCIVGKSNMFRKSHLDQVTAASGPPAPGVVSRPTGIDHFSFNICEDHLIGDLLWKSKIPGFLNHGIVWGDLVIQPMAGMGVASYAARRVRWLRARKFTVLAATLVEPGVESVLCCAHFTFALTTLPWINRNLGIPQTWAAAGCIWLLAMAAWMLVDWFTFQHLQAGNSTKTDQNTPKFARGTLRSGGMAKRPFSEWLPAWIGREALALPIWVVAVLLGTTVSWRGRSFSVNMDGAVKAIGVADMPVGSSITIPELERERPRTKNRLD
ncbi:ceramide glucosyltransferase, putative [Cordyceps militaris CM01]|uniref:Ceramide glucosyltransferase n=1 Tax=Cordyceps militaris (strain CM01) TaxID=983644 RepID=G3JU70_CORMM|nr:ceramide glucosyltransferase, putative [Cordyceps militaris CM01]EGX87898.1 ceramide glucosyltransferase, putative [Cordyceps militaris CM01]